MHLLQLNRAIVPKAGGIALDGTLSVQAWRTEASQKDLEAGPEKQLCGTAESIAEIAPGFYLFTQGIQGADGPDEAEYRNAAEAVWLESIWRKSVLKNDRVLIRTLQEDGRTVFQVFREICTE